MHGSVELFSRNLTRCNKHTYHSLVSYRVILQKKLPSYSCRSRSYMFHVYVCICISYLELVFFVCRLKEYACMHMGTCMRISVHRCVRFFLCVHTFGNGIHAYIHTYIHTYTGYVDMGYIHTYIHTYTHTYVMLTWDTYIHTYIHTRIHMLC
jgi:hypothetical protein